MAARKRKNITVKQVQDSERKPVIPNVDVHPEIDTDDCGDDGLTIRQRLFVEAITGSARGNATKAAEMAGYRSDNRVALAATAYENLRKPQIQEAIAHALARKCGSGDWAEASLIDLARSSMANFVSVGADGEPRIDFAKAAEAGAIGHIKEFTADILPGGEGEAKVIRCKIKVHDRTHAIETLLKMRGRLNDQSPQNPDTEVKVRPMSGGTVRNRPDAPDAGRESGDVQPE